MPISSLQLRITLQKPYDRIIFSKEVLSPVFNNGFSLSSSLLRANLPPTQSESKVISDVFIYGQINLEDGTEITCYEVNLQPDVRIDYSKVAIQHYVRKLLTAGQAAFINFVSPSDKNLWRLSLVAKDSILTDTGIKERTTNSKRYTYLLGPYESCKTAAERFESLSTQTRIDFDSLVNAFSVEKLSKTFFDEYTRHYESFVKYITKSNYKKVVFNGDEKAIRDFTKKLLGRIVFLYFVQKKGWLGATDTDYKDGNKNFIMDLFTQSGAGENFYPQWLTTLFFDTLNNSSRKDDVFEMPDGSKIKIPFLNGGLFDKEEYDEKLLTFKSKLFHNHNNDEDPKERGFLDFLNAFNFTIYEDSPDEKTVAVDPEMLGHIFENLLEDNKDKGAFYTPKEIVHYMCQESLIEYLSTHLSKEYTVYRPIDSEQVEIFGNETRTGQLKIIEEIGDKALNRDDVRNMVKRKDIDNLTLEQIKLIDRLIDNVKICDPAIGSGAFPMGLLLEIYSLKELIAYKFGLEWKPYQVKENIIQKSIYGVDIEKGAVDIARLRFWLSLVVDEEKPKPLPNLDYKIVVGDSLVSKFDGEIIEIEWNRTKSSGKGEEYLANIKRLLLEVSDKQRKYFDPSNRNKKKLSSEIRNLKIDLLINQVSLNRLIYINKNVEVLDSGFGLSAKEKAKNAEIQLTIEVYDNLLKKLGKLKNDPDTEFNHFNWKLDFPEILNPYLINGNGGFDIVIANPPYGAKLTQKEIEFIENKFRSNISRIKNSAIYFVYLNDLLRVDKENVQSYIIPKSVAYSNSWNPCAKYINNGLIKLIDTGKAFENVRLEQVIFARAVGNKSTYYTNGIYRDKSIYEYSNIPRNFFDEHKVLICGISNSEYLILELILKNSKQRWGTYLTSVRGLNWQSKVAKNPGKTPIYRGAQLRKYKLLPATDFISLKKFAKSVYEYQQKPETLNQLAIAHVLNPYPHFYLQATVDYENKIVFETIAISTLKDDNLLLNYFLGLNNSKIFAWLVYKYIYSNAIRSTRFDEQYISRVPIPNADKNIMLKIDTIVLYILHLESERSEDSNLIIIPRYFEQIIDGIVYELYFPDSLKKHGREIIKHLGELPEINDSMSDEKKLDIIKKVFNRLNAKDHPVRVNLFYMDSIPEIRIIEGKNENN